MYTAISFTCIKDNNKNEVLLFVTKVCTLNFSLLFYQKKKKNNKVVGTNFPVAKVSFFPSPKSHFPKDRKSMWKSLSFGLKLTNYVI